MNRQKSSAKTCRGLMIIATSALTLSLLAASCNSGSSDTQQTRSQPEPRKLSAQEIAGMTFDELFVEIAPAELTDNVFKLFGADFTVLTSGNMSDDNAGFNSMTVGYGGFGIQFGVPSTWSFLRANRYTLEFIRSEKTYTMSWFDEEHRDAVMYFGSMTGRGTDKMANNPLTAVTTPNGNAAYKEARLIVESNLTQITTVAPDDFYSESGRQFVVDAFADAQDYHKLVFGEITKVWVRR